MSSFAHFCGRNANNTPNSWSHSSKINTHVAEAPVANDPNSAENSNAVKDPDTGTTGDEEMTGAQKSYLKTLSDQAGVKFDETLTKAETSKKIDELQQKTGRGEE